MRRIGKEVFINRSNLIHSNKYSYNSVVYINNTTKVIINCNKHGDFLQKPNVHLMGSGCPKCANENRNNKRKKTNKEIVIEFKKVHGDKYDYSMVKYEGFHDRVKIICPIHGIFEKIVSDHINGGGCAKCSYENYSKKHSMTKREFIEKSIRIHGDRYNYDNVVYKNSSSKVSIICSIHGEFTQSASKHLSGQGCRICGIKSANDVIRRNPSGWGVTNWEESAKRSKFFDSFKVYIIKCTGNGESFYKIGRTFKTIKKRFNGKSTMPYNFTTIVVEVFDSARGAFNRESELKMLNNKFRYCPQKSFNGMYECFYKINFDLINNIDIFDK